MNIALIGAGIVGVTTAYELARAGHQVTVLERHGAAAEEASFAHAGLLSPGLLAPWAGTGLPALPLSRGAPLRLGAGLGWRELAWLWRWRRARHPARLAQLREPLQQLARYSHQRQQALREELHLEPERSEGHLVLLRSEAEARRLRPGLQALLDAGLRGKEISADEARRIEPALCPDTALAGAFHLPDDEVVNGRQFALLLKTEAQALGVAFEFQQAVEALVPGPRPALRVAGAVRPFDAIVVCAGVDSARLLRPLGVKLPLLAVPGYSVSAPVREPLHAPRSAVTDGRDQVTITRLGQRVRVAGGAELGRGTAHEAAPLRQLYQVLLDWFPGAASMSAGVQEWKGLRPTLPDGPPLLGACGAPGIWLNLGHGGSGGALACGSARLLADLLSGRPADLDPTGYSVERYR